MLQLKKNFVVLSGIIFMFGFILIFGGLFYLETDSGQAKIMHMINAEIRGEMSWKRVHLSPFSGIVEIVGFELKGPDKKQLVRCERLAINIEWLRLFKEEICLSSILLESPGVNIQTDHNGSLTIVTAVQPLHAKPEKPEKSPGLFPFNIKVDTFVLTDGQGLFCINDEKMSGSVSGFKLLIKNFDLKAKKAVLNAGADGGSFPGVADSVDLKEFNTHAVFNDGSLDILSFDLVAGGIKMGGQGSIKDLFHTPVSDFFFDVQAELEDVSKLFQYEPGCSGEIVSHINLTGRGVDPEKLTANIVLDLNLKQFSINGLDSPIDAEFKAGVGIENQKLLVRSFNAVTKGIYLSGEGEFEPGSGNIAGKLDLMLSDLGLTPGLIQMKGTGSVNLSGQVTGAYTSPEVKLELTSDNLGFGDIFLGNLDVTASMDSHGRVFIDQLSLENQGSKIGANGWIDLLKSDLKDFSLVDKPRFLVSLAGESMFLGDFMDGTEGRLSVNGSVNGTLDALSGNINMEGEKLDLNGRKIDGFVLKTVLEGQEINIKDLDIRVTPTAVFKSQGRAVFADNRLELGLFAQDFPLTRLKGEYDFDDHTFSASIDMAELFDLSPYLHAAGQPEFSGSVRECFIRSSGSLDDLQGVQVTADLTNLTVGFKENQIAHIPGVNLVLENGRFTLPETRITFLEQGEVKIEGAGSLKSDIDLELKGMLPFQVIRPFFEEISNVSGNIILSASLKGTVAEPVFNADVKLERLGLSLSGMEQKLQNIDGVISITPDLIETNRISGKLDEGTFDIAGNVGLSNLKPDTYNLKFNSHNLSLDFPDLMDITMNTSLSLAGNTDKSDLKGEIVLLEGRYYKNIELDLVDAVKKTRTVKPVPEKQAVAFLDNIGLDIDISQREPFLVDNNLALLSMYSDLTVSGTAAHPLVGGQVRVESGILKFKEKEFEVKKGVVDFINPYKTEPVIDIQGEMEIRHWTVFLTVSGTPDNLDFKFSSIPEEQHADIISLLAFGKTTRELRQGESDSSFSPEDILAGFVAQTLQQNIKEASGMDYLEIKPDDVEGSRGINIVVGKELSRRMMLKYGMDVRDGETVQRVIMDYKFLENLLMSGFQDNGGDFGAELKYRIEFR
ncbi:conserved uncharacterized protein, DUF490 [Desulfobacula toluolica Tol2]|uniref:Conserved uncharacterized protein, DUF490 n=2 Tax=Desulfobacula toluolica TaxID=28223 RepID=K0NL63_DESTT|nr:conserved uncharacterized protein, DUF490 [Desulfobacula toluolica Tol2]